MEYPLISKNNFVEKTTFKAGHWYTCILTSPPLECIDGTPWFTKGMSYLCCVDNGTGEFHLVNNKGVLVHTDFTTSKFFED